MVTMLKQTHHCHNVFILFLIYTLIFSSGAASTKDSEIGESLVSSRSEAKRHFGVMSLPPSCVSKCEGCRPCTPILVIVPPSAFHRPDDYYPLVWKCTCGGKLYNP